MVRFAEITDQIRATYAVGMPIAVDVPVCGAVMPDAKITAAEQLDSTTLRLTLKGKVR